MRVGTRLSAAFLVLIVLFGALLLFYHRVLERSVSAGRELAEVDSRILLGTSSQIDLLGQLAEDAEKYRITLDTGYLRAFRSWRGAISDTIATLRGLDLTGPQRETVEEAARAWGSLAASLPELGSEDEARFLAGASETEWSDFLGAAGAAERSVRGLRLASRAAVAQKVRDVSRNAERAAQAGWVAMGIALVIAGGLAVWIVRSIARPLVRIEAGAEAIARGRFEHRVDPIGGPEFASLARSFNEMARRVGELDRAKRDFLARISHDLKTPLASIQETKRVLLDRVPGDVNARQERLLELGLANADRLSAMISRLLELSRLEAGVEEYMPEPLDLGELCEKTVERIARPKEETSERHLEVRRGDSDLEVVADRGALERVLENLIDNAREHGGDGPIEVVARADRGPDGARRVRVEVKDSGPGIPPEDRGRIFEAFAGGHGNRAGGSTGHVGLGLAICREIVAAHGGTIWVEDDAGEGSVFAFALPGRSDGNG